MYDNAKSSNQADDTQLDASPPQIQTDEDINNEAEGTDPIPSTDKGSAINDGVEEKKNTLQEIIKRLGSKNTITPTNNNENNNIDHKENNIHVTNNKIEDQTTDVEEDPFGNMADDLFSEPTTPGDLEPEENKIEVEPVQNNEDKTTSSKKKKKRKKKKSKNIQKQDINENDLQTGAENIVETSDVGELKIAQVSDPEKPSTSSKKKKKRKKKKKLENTPAQKINENVLQTGAEDMEEKSDTGQLKIAQISDTQKTSIENTQGTPESTTPEDLEPENNNMEVEDDQNIEGEKISENIPEQDVDENDLQTGAEDMVEKSDTGELKIAQNCDPEKTFIEDNQENKIKESETITESKIPPHPLGEIDQKDLTLSPLENVEIVKIKGEPNSASEVIRKEKKRSVFKEFAPTEGNARIYCTFLGNVLKMYNKVKKRFVGHFCHAIVFGTPIILKQHRAHLSENMKNQLLGIHLHKQLSLLIVIMEYPNYKSWVNALRNTKGMKNLIIDIIHMAVHYKIDGIQFSNLHPKKGATQINSKMMDNLIKFFVELQLAAKEYNHDLKIGITIDVHALSVTKSFTSFPNLNSLVTWYSFKTISMVTCSSAYKTIGTSPLEGNMGFIDTMNAFMEQINYNNDFDMTKLVVGIQLFPNKENELQPYTYEELCSTPKHTWHTWCAVQPEDLRLKGRFLRGTPIGGVQLYYMHSDDYRSTCGCYSFPLIRALLRGLIKVEASETCNFETAHN